MIVYKYQSLFKALFLCVISIFISIPLQSQKSRETSFQIIIDTDCGVDDARAIAYLLSQKEVEIKGCIVSEGNVTVDEGIRKVSSLFEAFNKGSIPIAGGIPLLIAPPAWRGFNNGIVWGNNPTVSSIKANDLLKNILSKTDQRITYIGLGPLTNLARLLLDQPELAKKIEKVIWYNSGIKPLTGFNYTCDPKSVEIVFSSKLRIDVVSNLNISNAVFDLPLYNLAIKSSSPVSRVITAIHQQPDVNKLLANNHFKFWDDLVAIYLLTPELFDMDILPENRYVRYSTTYEGHSVREVISDILKDQYTMEKNIVFNSFPSQPEQFNYDIRIMMDSIIQRHGKEEWKACVMTDEFHGHLGVFSIVGAKMGIKAREYFGVGTDQLVVTSYAGNKPPYSCLTDGIQVSTGATLGMGTIKVLTDSVPKPKAVFTYKDRTIELSLKDEYLKMVDSDIAEGIVKYGLMDDGYWKLIRRNAIKYWNTWDRNDIFMIKEYQK